MLKPRKISGQCNIIGSTLVDKFKIEVNSKVSGDRDVFGFEAKEGVEGEILKSKYNLSC